MEVKTIEVGNEKTKTLADFLEKDLSRLLLALLVKSTLPTERAPFVALRHFPRFIGDICPFHRESIPQRGKQEMEFMALFLFIRMYQKITINPFLYLQP